MVRRRYVRLVPHYHLQESVDSLIEAVNQSLGIEEELASSSDHKVSFKRAKRAHRVFSSHPEFEDLIRRNREHPDKRFSGPRALKARLVSDPFAMLDGLQHRVLLRRVDPIRTETFGSPIRPTKGEECVPSQLDPEDLGLKVSASWRQKHTPTVLCPPVSVSEKRILRIVLYITVRICSVSARKNPLRTLLEAITVGIAVTFYDVAVVLQAFILTTAVFFGLTAFTFQSKRDFSKLGAGLFAGLWILVIAGFLRLFFYSETIELVMAAGGALLFCGFIIYDTHVLMHKLSPEEHILAAINLYLDIINLFLHLLRLLQALNKK
ncbi:unnamed protein product [Ranitomeya imitator]|uniref:Protein lifeguard 4 n=1 Tax=Ranitomeya imitator TaxID=111125 RepID=A0ABN9L9T5_9NEOB|nr:unnamed protein product [Ranitomeya imitator]